MLGMGMWMDLVFVGDEEEMVNIYKTLCNDWY